MDAPAREPVDGTVLLAVPAFGLDHLTDAVLADLLRDPPADVPGLRIAVVDNRGDYRLPVDDPRVSLVSPGRNLRWLGTVNWTLDAATEAGDVACVVLNNDTRLSPGFLHGVLRSFVDCADTAVATSVYDDFWLHQRATMIPAAAEAYVPTLAYRSVPFCDGTAFAVSVAAAARIGRLDADAFPEHGYGADIDYALRARDLGYRCVVTEAAFLHHRRRGTMASIPEETGEKHRAEILTGLARTRGPRWRAQAGLGPDAFPPLNTGSAADWYL